MDPLSSRYESMSCTGSISPVYRVSLSISGWENCDCANERFRVCSEPSKNDTTDSTHLGSIGGNPSLLLIYSFHEHNNPPSVNHPKYSPLSRRDEGLRTGGAGLTHRILVLVPVSRRRLSSGSELLFDLFGHGGRVVCKCLFVWD